MRCPMFTPFSRRPGPLLRLLPLAMVAALVGAVLASEPVSDQTLRSIPSGNGDFDIHHGPLLAPILIPRAPGTPGSLAVQRHFVDFFTRRLPGWRVEWHNTTSKTPATGDRDVPFANLVFSREPPWARPGDVARLTLVAHYDSLARPEGFVGAVDSAAPCAMLMHVARSIDAALTAKWRDMEAAGSAGTGFDEDEDEGVQIVLLDGEEAFVSWSASDSLYGARALAEHWDSAAYPAMSTYRTPLDAISLFLLIDLLGAPDPAVPSYFADTHWAYENMARLERRMRALGLLRSSSSSPSPSGGGGGKPSFFLPELGKAPAHFKRGYFVEDDHVPFMRRGLDRVLHLIPHPFPAVWHTLQDDGPHLDAAAVDDWAKILTAFAVEWMGLEGFMGDGPGQQPFSDSASRKPDQQAGADRSKDEL